MRKLLWTLPTMLTIVACSGPSAAAGGNSWIPSNLLISEIEGNLKMPPKAFPLHAYARYFAGEVVNDRRIVVGIFLHDTKNSGVRIIDPEKMPQVLDGGCDVVNLKYDVERKEVLALFCNGHA